MSHALARSVAQLLFGGVVTATVVFGALLIRDAHRAGVRRVRGGGR